MISDDRISLDEPDRVAVPDLVFSRGKVFGYFFVEPITYYLVVI
jgi:hypothetical protein